MKQIWHRKKELLFYKKLIKVGDLCFDIGANNGAKSTIFLNIGAKVVAFEPQNSCYQNLQKIKNPNFYIEKCGITKENEIRDFHISNITDISTFSEKFIDTYKSNLCKWEKNEPIKCYSLDHFIKKYGVPDYCKIDVEGLELEIIKSLKTKIPLIEFESTSAFLMESIQCIKYLNTMNYQFKILKDSSYKFYSEDWLNKENAIKKLKKYAYETIHTNIYCSQKK